MRVSAKAQRSEGWWAVEVPEVEGVFTQARRLEQIPEMVRDAVALVERISPDEVEVEVFAHVSDLDRLLDETREARSVAERAAELAATLTKEAAEQLARQGVTVRDTGEILGVSAQRVSQILATTAKSQTRAAGRVLATKGRAGRSVRVQ